MVDGLSNHLGEIGSESILDAGVASEDLADSIITTAKLSDNAVSGLKISSEFGNIGTGSPTSFGLSTQVGQDTLGAGSDVWVSFGTAFAGTPKVTVSYADSTLTNIATGSAMAGSVYVIGQTASKVFDWVATGSGRI